MFEGFLGMFGRFFYFFGLNTVVFELLHAKPCRIIWKLPQKVRFGSETCKIEPKHVFQMHFYENVVCGLQTTFLIMLACSWVFWPKNDTERIWNYLKKHVLDPKRAKFDQKSAFGVSGGQGFPPKIPPSFTEHLQGNMQKPLLLWWNSRNSADRIISDNAA